MSLIIIDDEDIVLQTLLAILRRENIPADIERNPVVALKRFETENYHLALVDIVMPEMKGVEVIRAIKATNPLCNVIMMTAFSKMSWMVECIEAGAVDYITKPFTDINLLVTIVRQSLDRVERWKKSFGLKV